MEESLKRQLEAVIPLLKEHKVIRAKASFSKDSDIDLLIAFDEKIDPVEYGVLYFDLAEKLEFFFHRPVDLLTEASLKNPYLIDEINREKIPLYE